MFCPECGVSEVEWREMILGVALLSQEYVENQNEGNVDLEVEEDTTSIQVQTLIKVFRCKKCGHVFFDKDSYRGSRGFLEDEANEFANLHRGSTEFLLKKIPPEIAWVISGSEGQKP